MASERKLASVVDSFLPLSRDLISALAVVGQGTPFRSCIFAKLCVSSCEVFDVDVTGRMVGSRPARASLNAL